MTILSRYYMAVQDFLAYCCITSTGEHHSTPFFIHPIQVSFKL